MACTSLFKRNLLGWMLLYGCTFLGAGCSQETPPPGVGYPPLVGTWKLVQKTISTDSSLVVKTVAEVPAQSLTFESDGKFSSQGDETKYYRSTRYYKVDSAQQSPRIGFIPGQIYAAFYQNFTLKNDSLVLLPCASNACDLVFVKRR